MKTFLTKTILRFWPILTFLVLVVILFLLNFRTGTFLTGWDNLHPEYFLSMNIKRSIFAVWQEYQGLGLLGGMGHASDLIHQLVLAVLATFLPDSFLRYVWTFMLLFVGASGMYVCLNRSIIPHKSRLIAFIGGFFYLLNIATLQTFFVPFEAFIGHFASLPWMLFGSLFFLDKPNKKRFVLLCLILFFSTPEAYIPTLFVVYLLALGVLLVTRFLFTPTKQLIKSTLFLGVAIFLMNAFWLLPFAYFTATNSQVNLNSKINQMATETIYDQNKEFGDPSDVALLKGFWFNNVDPNLDQQFSYMLTPWRDYYANWYVIVAGYLIFAIILLGVISVIKSRHKQLYPFVALFLFCLTALAVATPPFSFINILIRTAIPLLNQAFRFPFTKFSLLTGFTYALFLALGIEVLFAKTRNKFTNYHLQILLPVVMVGLIVIGIFPMFTGNLFYNKERLSVPEDYFSLFDFFKKQDPTTRIADFPQHTFWGWNFYNWGYGGSGFLWYGIQQPILDRAFDVWSAYDENYYDELSQALYAKNAPQFDQVLQKYQISWLLVDQNVVNPISPKALFYPQLKTLLAQLPDVAEAKQFGNILIYHVTLQDHPTNFVFATSPLPTVNSYTWNNADQAYTILGNYATSQSPDLIYPFRSLASQKTVGEHEFTSTVSHTQVELSAPATTLTHSAFLTIPSSNSEEILPATFIGTKQGTQFTISARVSSPEVWDGQKKIWGTSTLLPILTLPLTSLASQNNVFLSINGVATLPLHTGTLGTSFLSLTEDNVLTVGSGSTLLTKQTLPATTLTTLPILRGGSVSLNKGTHHLKVVSPFVNDSYLGRDILGEDISQKLTCDAFRQGQTDIIKGFDTLTFMALNATSCGSLYFSSLPHNLSYLITINHRNLQGRSLHFWILNQDAQYAPIDTYLPSNKTFEADSFVLPPQEAFGQAYSLHFDNTSIGKDNVENEIKEVSITPLPYAFITNLRIQEAPTPQSSIKPPLAVVHPNESLYLVLSPIPSPSTIVLSQAYDAGWQAYVVNQQNSRPTKIVQLLPFFFGQRLTTHVKVNTWENGWKITTPLTTHQQIIIVYLPQYLEYLGWIFLFGGLAGGLVVYFRHKT